MLFLIFYLGEQRYALAAQEIVEVVPVVQLKRIPQAPSYVAGLCNYRGAPVPIIDLARIIEKRAANRYMSTRVVMVHFRLPDGAERILGLIAERATEMMTLENKDFVESGVTGSGITCCRRVAIDADGMIHRVELDGLLSESVREVIFR